jgi:hypothetical protein
MDDDKRVAGLLELARQHMQRYHELEEIEWKINFSVWGALGGFAYLLTTKNLTMPAWLKERRPVVGITLIVLAIHGIALYQLNRQQQKNAILREGYRDHSDEILAHTRPVYAPWRLLGVRWTDWAWIAWDLAVTLAILAALVLLVYSGSVSAH